MRRSYQFFLQATWIVWLTSCGFDQESTLNPKDSLYTMKLRNPELKKVWKALEAQDYSKASREMNQALQLSPRKPAYHLINGIIYDKLEHEGSNETQVGLSQAAYLCAYNLDPSQWIHAYLLGLSELREQKYIEAQLHLKDALILSPKNIEIMYALAFASYHAKDIAVTKAMLERALALQPQNPKIVRGMIMAYAACEQFDKAKQCIKLYATLKDVKPESVEMCTRRVQDWQLAYQTSPKMTKIENESFLSVSKTDAAPDPNAAAAAKAPEESEDVTSIFFDCYMFQYQEAEQIQSGQNIMTALQIILAQTPLVQVTRHLTRNTQTNVTNPVQGSWTKDFGLEISQVGLKYSLNLANARRETTSVLSRPSLHTIMNKKATLLSGSSYTGGVNGSIGASAATIDAGIGLEITPLSLSPEGVLTMHIRFSGSFFTDNPEIKSGFSSQLISTTRSRIETTIKSVIGQTVLIGGIYTKQSAENEDRTPLLGDIPIAQYLFAGKSTSSKINSIGYLITARIGGSEHQLHKIDRKKVQRIRKAVHSQLKNRGLMSVGEFSNSYYIFGGIERSPLFLNFRSGDLEHPDIELVKGTADIESKLHLLAQFLYY